MSTAARSKKRIGSPFSTDRGSSFNSKTHLCFVSFPAESNGRSREGDQEGQVTRSDILCSPSRDSGVVRPGKDPRQRLDLQVSLPHWKIHRRSVTRTRSIHLI